MTRARSAITPRIYAHRTRSEWGRAVISEARTDRATYAFENGGARTFMSDSGVMIEVELPPAEREALARTLLRAARAPSTGKRARPSATTFDGQLASFHTWYPDGFDDPDFLLEDRGTRGPDDRETDAGIALAAELFAAPALAKKVARGQYTEIVEDAQRVTAAMRALALPKPDVSALAKMPVGAHEPFARALERLLHGSGTYEARFDALVPTLPSPVWTIATLLPASLRPGEHVFVKPALGQRQASALGLAPPPAGPPSGAAYARHLAVASAVRARLLSAGQHPRDLLDIYAFTWRTLARA